MRKRKTKERCPHCGHIVEEREIIFYRGLARVLYRVWQHCQLKEKHIFQRKEVKHLFAGENDTARFGDLVWFGLLYRLKNEKTGKVRKGGWYGIPEQRVKEFFEGKYAIPTKIWVDPLGEVKEKTNYKTIKEIPSILRFLDGEGVYVPEYRQQGLAI